MAGERFFNWMECILAPPTKAYDWLAVFLPLTHWVCPSAHRTDPCCPWGKLLSLGLHESMLQQRNTIKFINSRGKKIQMFFTGIMVYNEILNFHQWNKRIYCQMPKCPSRPLRSSSKSILWLHNAVLDCCKLSYNSNKISLKGPINNHLSNTSISWAYNDLGDPCLYDSIAQDD